tara:strand:+ start:606 stop:2060 length:1455 start_codon:yes stop_codon:yes gene_type:complete
MSYKDVLKIHNMKMENDSLTNALDMLYNVAATGYSIESKNEKEREQEEKFNRELRSVEVGRLSRLHPGIPLTDYGNPVYNEEDFQAYKNEIIQKENLNTLGRQFVPTDGVISQEAQQDMFTYGDTRYSLDETAGIVSQEDLLNFDAWLLGEGGYGRDIAKRHNHMGILNESITDSDSPYYGRYVLDAGDYHDLKDKGLLPNMMPDASGNYLLNETQRNDVIKKYNYWREGFVSSRELPTKSSISTLIAGENARDLEFENNLRKNKKYENVFNQLDSWKDVLNPEKPLSIIDDNGDYTADYISDGELRNESLTQKQFMKKYPLVYNMLKTNFTIESVFQDVSSNIELQQQLEEIPSLKEYFYHLFGQLQDVESQRRKAGIGLNQYQHVNNSMIVGEARDIVLNDLRGGKFDYGVLYDPEKYAQLNSAQKDTLMDKLIDLEAQYANPQSLDYNENVLRFLSLYGYNDGQTVPGEALANILQELRQQ